MVIVEIVKNKSEKLVFDGDDYLLHINKKQLFKFYHKIKGLSPKEVDLIVKQFVEEKKKSKIKDNYYNREIIHRNIEMLSKTLIKYMEDEVSGWDEVDTEEEIKVAKSYKFEVEEDYVNEDNLQPQDTKIEEDEENVKEVAL